MKYAELVGPKAVLGATSVSGAADPLPHKVGARLTRALPIFITVAALSGLLLTIVDLRPVHSQGVKLVTVDVNVVAQGYRISKLTGAGVTNEKNEKIGSIDDFVVGRDRALFAVLQVGGFLGMGGHLVAVPYESLVIDDEGRTVQLPGASRDELKRLPEIRYRG
jgi:hypothetical protein